MALPSATVRFHGFGPRKNSPRTYQIPITTCHPVCTSQCPRSKKKKNSPPKGAKTAPEWYQRIGLSERNQQQQKLKAPPHGTVRWRHPTGTTCNKRHLQNEGKQQNRTHLGETSFRAPAERLHPLTRLPKFSVPLFGSPSAPHPRVRLVSLIRASLVYLLFFFFSYEEVKIRHGALYRYQKHYNSGPARADKSPSANSSAPRSPVRPLRRNHSTITRSPRINS